MRLGMAHGGYVIGLIVSLGAFALFVGIMCLALIHVANGLWPDDDEENEKPKEREGKRREQRADHPVLRVQHRDE